MAAAIDPSQYSVSFNRTFNAPRSLVWQAWTDPKHVAQWWGPHGFTNPVCDLDVRTGGAMRIHMQGPKGTPFDGLYPMTGVYREVSPPERMVFVSSALDENGQPLFEVLTTVTFTEQGNKTKMAMKAEVVSTTEKGAGHLAGMEQGWSQSLDRLETFLAKV
jgi:uncharacterized protein YndB with AHSA1/START domain